MEKKIIEIFEKNEMYYADIRELGLCFGFDEDVIEDVELVDGAILFHTEFGDVGSFDMLATYQQKAIFEHIVNNFYDNKFVNVMANA